MRSQLAWLADLLSLTCWNNTEHSPCCFVRRRRAAWKYGSHHPPPHPLYTFSKELILTRNLLRDGFLLALQGRERGRKSMVHFPSSSLCKAHCNPRYTVIAQTLVGAAVPHAPKGTAGKLGLGLVPSTPLCTAKDMSQHHSPLRLQLLPRYCSLSPPGFSPWN